MKQVQKNLETVAKGMKALTKKVEKLQGQLAKIEKAQVVRKVKPKAKRKAKAVKKVPAGKKPAKATAPEKILQILQGNEQGVDTATLRKKTGFDARKLQVTLFRMKKQGKIKSVGKGVYARAEFSREDHPTRADPELRTTRDGERGEICLRTHWIGELSKTQAEF